jgi:parvulin-like peptidyl-prolyl isomerase
MRGTAMGCMVWLLAAQAQAQERGPAHAPARQPGPVAVVNGEPITWPEWQEALSRLPAPPAGFPAAQLKNVHQELLSLMIDERLLKQFLAKAVPAVTEEQVRARIAEIQKGLEARKTTIQEYLRETRQTVEQFRAGVAAELQWQSYVGQRSVTTDLKAYYEQNREMFDGVAIRVSHIVLSAPPDCEPGKLQELADRLRALRADIVKGADFAECARKYSEDKTSGKLGGDLGYLAPRRTDADPFIRTASLLKVGEVSDVVRTDFGLHLIKQTERRAGQPTQYEAMKDTVRAVWADELRVAVILEQRKSAKIEVKLPAAENSK